MSTGCGESAVYEYMALCVRIEVFWGGIGREGGKEGTGNGDFVEGFVGISKDGTFVGFWR